MPKPEAYRSNKISIDVNSQWMGGFRSSTYSSDGDGSKRSMGDVLLKTVAITGKYLVEDGLLVSGICQASQQVDALEGAQAW